MFGAIYNALSGMEAYSDGLTVLSNNIANLNTDGFKESTVGFSALYTEGDPGNADAGASGNDKQGSGVEILPSMTNFSQGTLSQTSSALDLAIQGGGFLTLLGASGSSPTYVRTGSFTTSPTGAIVDSANNLGLAILGPKDQLKAATTAGYVTNPPLATTTIPFAGNLSSSGTAASVTGITVYDSSGDAHTWAVGFASTNTPPDSWNLTITDETGATIGTGTLSFIGSDPDPATAKITVTTTYAHAKPLSVVLDFSKNVTYFSGGDTSTIAAGTVNGYAVGSISSVSVNDAGALIITYSNSQTVNLGQVALAQFDDPQALQQQTGSGGVFNYTGIDAPKYSISGHDGIGTLVSGQLEQSNVDLSQEFGELIVVQRGYQASSEVISTANDMIQQLFGIRGQA